MIKLESTSDLAKIGGLGLFLLYLTLFTTDLLYVFGSAAFDSYPYENTFFYAARLVGSLALLVGILYRGFSWARHSLIVTGLLLIVVAFTLYPGTIGDAFWQARVVRFVLLISAGIFAVIGAMTRKN